MRRLLKSTRKEDPEPYPTRPPLKLLVDQETWFSMWQNQQTYLSIVLGSFYCQYRRSTQFTSVSASDLAIVHTRNI